MDKEKLIHEQRWISSKYFKKAISWQSSSERSKRKKSVSSHRSHIYRVCKSEEGESFSWQIEQVRQEPIEIEQRENLIAPVLSTEEIEFLRESAKCETAERESLFLNAAQKVFTESDEVLRRLADR